MQNLPKITSREVAYKLAEEIRQERADNRARETMLQARLMTAKSNPVIQSDNLASNLAKVLPPHLMPKNIGRFDGLMWDFSFPVVFDFGVDPTFDQNTRVKQTFKVNQDGAFLLMGMSWVYESKLKAGKGAPLLVNIQSNQTDKRYNDLPFPIQNIGRLGNPTLFKTPLLIPKNTSVDVELTTADFITGNFPTVGSGYHEIRFFGMKVRNEESLKVIQTLFA